MIVKALQEFDPSYFDENEHPIDYKFAMDVRELDLL